MKRKTFKAFVTDASGNRIIGERVTYAWNSAIRATEAILREYGREHVGPLHGGRPVSLEDDGERIYRRIWTAPSGAEFRALVWEVVD